MKISSCELVTSQKYENGYRSKICDFTVNHKNYCLSVLKMHPLYEPTQKIT